MWPLLPKQHQLELLIFDLGVYRNPRHCCCVLDEDLIGRVKRLAAHTHPRTMSVRVLEHYTLAATLEWRGRHWLTQ